MKTLPKIGYIALYNGYPIAAGFLRRVEGGYAQIDTLTSNPTFGSIIRHKGIDAIVNSLIEEAKVLKLHGIIALTQETNIILRATDKGFHLVEHKVLALPLKEI